ncbi:unnamed protein product [Porites lobata]|uniref:Gag-pol polyprotein n=1 Tax=Porites lobata TaxID=104759 RepID=A0ABN8PRB2_9CNID|nr:unnamed protein product [Porites lobata]
MEFESEDQRKEPDVILEKMEKYCIGECNETYERYVFNRRDQESNESVDAYVTALRKLAKTCNYGTLADSLIRDRIVVGINDNSARKKLLQAGKLTLSQCIDICRSSETSARQLKTMNQEDVRLVKEEKVNPAGKKRAGVSDNRPRTESRESRMTCKFCARQHPFAKKNCPAWETLARSAASQTILHPPQSREQNFCHPSCQRWEEKFQLDSGSTVNLMSDKTVERLCGTGCLKDLDKTSVTLVMYNQSEVKPLGKKRFRVTNPKNNKKYSIEFHIVGGVSPCKSILGLRASKHLQLLTINEHNILAVDSNGEDPVNLKKEDYISLYKDVFSGKANLQANYT